MQPDYYDLLQMPHGVEIDSTLLNQNYLALQQKFHPDKNKTGAAMSAQLNQAYSVLKDQYRRLEYLLRGEKLEACASLLEEMLELRENPEEGVEKAQAEIKKLYKECAGLYAKNETHKVAQNFVRIKYLRKFLDDVTANT